MGRDRIQHDARRQLARDARGLVTLFGRGTRSQLGSRVRIALAACPDYPAALRRHRAHWPDDVLAPPPLFRQVDRLIADLAGGA